MTHVWHLIHWPEPNTTWHPVSPSNSSAHFVQRKQWQNTAGIVLLKSFPSSMQKFLHPNILKIRFLTLKEKKENIGQIEKNILEMLLEFLFYFYILFSLKCNCIYFPLMLKWKGLPHKVDLISKWKEAITILIPIAVMILFSCMKEQIIWQHSSCLAASNIDY